jgi:glycosyltransferase involved in cell wall biosynthesis
MAIPALHPGRTALVPVMVTRDVNGDRVVETPVLLSVVVPVYAVEGYLYQCMESIRAGLTDAESDAVEIIAVDDASPDGCGEMLDGYAARRGGVRVVHLSSNVGLGLARNAGLAEARGEYVWFVDSDDWLPAGAVRAVLERLRATRPDLLLVDHLRVRESGALEVDASSHLLRGVDGPFRLAERRQMLRLQHTAWNKVVRRAFLESNDLRFLPGWYEDIPFSHPLLIAADSIDVLDRVCYHYRQGRLGAITSTRSHRHFDAFDQYERMHAWVQGRSPADWLTAELFALMISHYLVVAGNDGRLHPQHRRQFFRRAAQHYRRYAPGRGYPRPGGAAGLKHRLVRRNTYLLYAGIRAAYRVASRSRVRPAGPMPVPAQRIPSPREYAGAGDARKVRG